MHQIHKSLLLDRVWFDVGMVGFAYYIHNIYQFIGFALRPEISTKMLICPKFQVVQKTVDNL